MNTEMEPKLSRIGCALFRAERKITSSPQSMTLIQLRLTLACSSASSRLSLVFTSADGLGHAKRQVENRAPDLAQRFTGKFMRMPCRISNAGLLVLLQS